MQPLNNCTPRTANQLVAALHNQRSLNKLPLLPPQLLLPLLPPQLLLPHRKQHLV
jgi:hypothetical protein